MALASKHPSLGLKVARPGLAWPWPCTQGVFCNQILYYFINILPICFLKIFLVSVAGFCY